MKTKKVWKNRPLNWKATKAKKQSQILSIECWKTFFCLNFNLSFGLTFFFFSLCYTIFVVLAIQRKSILSNTIVPFQFNTHEIRVVLIGGEPWFVGKDVCDVLEIGNTSMAYSRLKDYEKLTSALMMSGQNRDYTCISESGLYRLVLTSRKPQAEPFQDWVVQEVLPSIRKTGSYSVQSQPQTPKLTANKLALEISRDVREITDNLIDNPRLAQFLIDLATSEVKPPH